MSNYADTGRAAGPGDEIAGLALRHLETPEGTGMEDIEAQIASALNEARWDDLSKWHRVKLRYIRFSQQRDRLLGA